jgi:hypothetical protein
MMFNLLKAFQFIYCGRPITATTDDKISKIQAFIKSDQYCPYDKIEAEFEFEFEKSWAQTSKEQQR